MSGAQPITITSAANPLVQGLRKLARDGQAYRKPLGLVGSAAKDAYQFWLEGDHLCEAARRSGLKPLRAVVNEQAWAQDATLRELAAWAPEVVLLPHELFASVSGLESPARMGYVMALPQAAPLQAQMPSLILDRVQDPGNVGSILRSAAAFGFAQVLALKGTAALWSPKVLRAGMGAHFALQLHEMLETSALAALELPWLGTSSHCERGLNEVQLPWPCAWVLGHEGQGVAPTLLERCAMQLRIPQPGGQESLNVAAAAAVCLYESSRQR